MDDSNQKRVEPPDTAVKHLHRYNRMAYDDSSGYAAASATKHYPESASYGNTAVAPTENRRTPHQMITGHFVDPTRFEEMAKATQNMPPMTSNPEHRITAKELKNAFIAYQNKHFSDSVCKFVVRLFDLDRNGGVDIKEFEQLYSYVKLWVEAFNKFDVNRAGFLGEKDFNNALKYMDIHFSSDFIGYLASRGDPTKRRVHLDQFITICVQIQKYTDEFKNRDASYSGIISLKYEDFLEMILRCV